MHRGGIAHALEGVAYGLDHRRPTGAATAVVEIAEPACMASPASPRRTDGTRGQEATRRFGWPSGGLLDRMLELCHPRRSSTCSVSRSIARDTGSIVTPGSTP